MAKNPKGLLGAFNALGETVSGLWKATTKVPKAYTDGAKLTAANTVVGGASFLVSAFHVAKQPFIWVINGVTTGVKGAKFAVERFPVTSSLLAGGALLLGGLNLMRSGAQAKTNRELDAQMTSAGLPVGGNQINNTYMNSTTPADYARMQQAINNREQANGADANQAMAR
jgi:hypothetical protein